jgi:uncharacterized tellurite resistance protein B-like protein
LQQIRAEVAQAAPSTAKLTEQYLKRQIEQIPPEALMPYPGIGPMTVERLRSAGIRSLAEAIGYDFERIGGIGPVKSRELRDAVKAAIADARSRLEAGASPEGQKLRRELEEGEAARNVVRKKYASETAALESTLSQLKGRVERAKSITFWKFLCGQSANSISAEELSQPLPELVVGVSAPAAVPPVIPVPPPVSLPEAVPSAQSTPRSVPLPPPPPPPPRTQPPTDIFLGSSPPPIPAPTVSPSPGLQQLQSLIRLGVTLAKADGRMAQAERKAIRTFLGDRFGHDPQVARHIDPTIERFEKGEIQEADLAGDLGMLATLSSNERDAIIRYLEGIADSTGNDRNPRKQALLAEARSALGVAAPVVVAAPPVSGPAPPAAPSAKSTLKPSARAILEIAEGTELSVELIRRRYTLLMEKVDPTKAAAMGHEFARMAEEKRLAIQAAAEELIAPFGVPVVAPEVPKSTEMRHNPDLDDVFGM